MFICVSSSPGPPLGVVVWLVLHATECRVEHFVTALVNRFATLSPENRRNIHVARTALRKACLLTLYDHAQRFHCDQRCHLWLMGDEFRICAASIWFISERVRPCGSKMLNRPHHQRARPFSGDTDRPAPGWSFAPHVHVYKSCVMHGLAASWQISITSVPAV